MCGSMALARIGRGKLSLCFKRNGNSITDLLSLLPGCAGLFGVVRGLFGDCLGFDRRPYPHAQKPVPCDF